MSQFTTGGKAPYIGRWGLFMEPNELLLASPGTDLVQNSYVSIGGYMANGTKQSNLAVTNYTGMVGIGKTTPASKLHVIGSITASSFVSSGGSSSQCLMADGSISSIAASYANAASMVFSFFTSIEHLILLRQSMV